MAEDQGLRYHSWTRRAARACFRPFIGMRLTPNHITALRWAAATAACGFFFKGDMVSGGLLWVGSAFLDRCDGEFARMAGLSSRFGYLFDLIGDIVFNGIVFAALGLGISISAALGGVLGIPGDIWLIIGGLAGGGVFLAGVLAEINEQGMKNDEKTFNGRWGFDFDDFAYLIGIIPCLGGAPYLLIGASIGGPLAAVVIGAKLARKRMAC